MTLEKACGTEDSISRTDAFSSSLLGWFDRHKRDLPWRQNRDPYRVWLSEIMLQQTRVAAVTNHYERFLRRFPSVEKLASAREASVLAAWSGLGYYRRARMLHAAAKKIVKEHGGKFPASAEDLRALPGIGRYTAAAIASIAFDQPVAVVDGNVERVLQRVQGKNLAGEELWTAAGELLSRAASGRFQPGHDGIGRDRMFAAAAPMSLVPGIRSLCDTRRTAKANKGNSPDEATHPLHARLPERISLPGSAFQGFDAHARHVGVAGDGRQRNSRSLAHCKAFHHRDRLCGSSAARCRSQGFRWTLGAQIPHYSVASNRPGAENPAGS